MAQDCLQVHAYVVDTLRSAHLAVLHVQAAILCGIAQLAQTLMHALVLRFV